MPGSSSWNAEGSQGARAAGNRQRTKDKAGNSQGTKAGDAARQEGLSKPCREGRVREQREVGGNKGKVLLLPLQSRVLARLGSC